MTESSITAINRRLAEKPKKAFLLVRVESDKDGTICRVDVDDFDSMDVCAEQFVDTVDGFAKEHRIIFGEGMRDRILNEQEFRHKWIDRKYLYYVLDASDYVSPTVDGYLWRLASDGTFDTCKPFAL